MNDSNNPFASEEITAPYSDHWKAKRRVAKALQTLIDVLVTSTPPTQELHSIADNLNQTAERFSKFPRLYGRTAFTEDQAHGTFGQVGHELNPLAGLSNPIAPPFNVWIKDDRAHGRVKFGWAYEGPPGSLHGGFVAAIFDQFLGVAQIIGKQPGMTGTLSVRYHNRTPLNTELRMEAWLERIEGRKTIIKGEMHAGDTLTASCEGLFIQPRGGMAKVRPLAESAGDSASPED